MAHTNEKAVAGGSDTAQDTAHAADNTKSLDFVTVLATYGPSLTKIYRSDGKTDAYDDAASFQCKEIAVTDLSGLSRLLTKLESRTQNCIIRGKYVGDDRAQPGKLEGSIARTNSNFDDCPHHWFMVDIDKYEPDFDDPVNDPVNAIRDYVARLLPPCFKDVSFHWQLSSSAGMPGKTHILKAHVWFWSETPYTSAQMYAWAKQTGIWIDKAVYRRVQIHYTANPIFEAGRDDPVPVRSGFYQGERDTVDLKIDPDVLEAARSTGGGTGGKDMKLTDPSEKENLIGLFHRTFDAHTVLMEHLEGMFAEGQNERRWTWLDGGGTPEGVWVHDDGMHVGATHNTWPIDGIANLWDLVRILKFGHLDRSGDDFEQMNIDEDQIQGKPSYVAMLKWAVELPEIKEALAEEKSAAHVLAKLRKMVPDEVASAWVALALPLPPSDRGAVAQEVARLTGKGVRGLKGDLAQAEKDKRKAEKRKAVDARTGARKMIRYQPENRTRHAIGLEKLILADAAQGEYLDFGGVLSRVAIKALPHTHLVDHEEEAPPGVPQIEALDETALLALAERVAVFFEPDSEGEPRPIALPDSVIKILRNKAEHHAKKVSGLVPHPIVTSRGEILASEGLHEIGLFVSNPVAGCRAYSQAEARAALARIRENLLDGFSFSTPLDADVAVAGLMTGIERKVLDSAPGLAVLAAMQSSGKTTLARRIHLILTGHDMPASSFPANEEETQKRLLALLLRSPTMVCFDNLADGFTFRSPSVALAMTSAVFEQRILGQSKDVSVPTNVLFVLTGNNLRLGKDEVSRWLVSRLALAESRPGERKYRHADVVTHGLSIRDAVLRDALGIIAGYVSTGNEIGARSRYQRWDRLVRQPLMWAGGQDVAAVFDANEDESEDAQALTALATGLVEFFGAEEFTAGEIADLLRNRGMGCPLGSRLFERASELGRDVLDELLGRLETGLEAMGVRDLASARAVGRALAGVKGRPAAVWVADKKHVGYLDQRTLRGEQRYSMRIKP